MPFSVARSAAANHVPSEENARLKVTALVLSPEGWLNPPLRYPDEPVRHKLIDAVGDLALLGVRLVARYEGVCAGHSLHRALLTRLLEAPELLEPCPAPTAAPVGRS